MAEDKRDWEEKEEEEEGRHCPQPFPFFSSRLFSKVLKAGCSRWFPPVEDVTVECINFIKAISIQGSRLPWRRCELSMWPCIMEQSKPYCKSLYKCILNAPLKALFITSMDWLVRKVLKSCSTPGSAARNEKWSKREADSFWLCKVWMSKFRYFSSAIESRGIINKTLTQKINFFFGKLKRVWNESLQDDD